MRRRSWIPAVTLTLLIPMIARAQDENLFERLDKNKDGFLSADEIDGDRKRMFERLLREGDKDKDGKLNKDEFAAALRDRPRDERANPAGDRPAAKPEGGQPAPREIFARFDKNEDGKLGKDEIPERMRENFDRIDTNRDGFIELDELRTAFAAMQGRGAEGRRPNPETLGRTFDGLDRNKDGKLTKDEVEGREFFQRLLGRFDGEKNGGLTKERFIQAAMAAAGRTEGDAPRREGDTRRPNAVAGRPMIVPFFAALDTNGDGEISADELANASKSLAKLDRNGDGKITRDELAPAQNRDR